MREWPGAGNTGAGLLLLFMGPGLKLESAGHSLEPRQVGLDPESDGENLVPESTGEGLNLGLWVQATRMVVGGGWSGDWSSPGNC